jgi:tRNA-splicing ligase RtcB (3'-phosphate/5'-hydroxy nucleic acid ligase)
MTADPRLIRLDKTRLQIVNPAGVDATLFANAQVPIESSAVDELIGVTELRQTTDRLSEHDPKFFQSTPELKKIAITPDFHKGAGIPIGTVLATRGYLVPQAIGNDINCGMRLHTTSLSADRVVGVLKELEGHCRHIYFEGGRDIPMSRVQRQAMFQEGLNGLLNATPKAQSQGLWSLFHEQLTPRELECVQFAGSFTAKRIYQLEEFLGPAQGLTRDGQIGSIGGGNHFVEFQRVERILDGTTAHAWGLRQGMLTIMVHSGSLSIGHRIGSRFRDVLRQVYPQSFGQPQNGIFLLPDGQRHRPTLDLFWDAMSNAANFAFSNRLFLGLMAFRALQQVCGDVGGSLVYDAPHNLVWKEQLDGEDIFLHRKGACPARGFEAMENTPFAYYGEPVLVPGSMGASSFVLAGRGNPQSLWSASHGAGRALSRGDALHGHDQEFEKFMREFRVVTPVDLSRPDIAMRRDIVDKKLEDIKKEAPYAYKGIGPIINTLTEAGIASPVAELKPLMTIKG